MLKAYHMYRLFNGPMQQTLDGRGREALIDRLEAFFPSYLAHIDVPSQDLLDAFNGIQFLPLDKNTYLSIQCFVNATEMAFPQVKYTVVLHNDRLVWSGLEQDDMRALYRYLTDGLLEAEANAAPTGSFVAERTSASPQRGGSPIPPKCGFLTGPEDLGDPDSPVNAPRLFLTVAGKLVELHLVIYQWSACTCSFFVEASALMDLDFYARLDQFVSPQLRQLDAAVTAQHVRRAASGMPEIPHRYLYFNHMNLAQKSSFLRMNKRTGPPPPLSAAPPEQMRLITRMHSDFGRDGEDREIILRSSNDCWVVGRRSDEREFFVILNHRNANLIEINEEIRRLSATHFNNIFLLN